ncbi:hypothetical protein NPIL_59821 [Nephila pilipes]|uniref:Uncharacterized protein n=1 Tax=Nephila pilipes TaxID=299642 RepID=A0A8X6P5W0_NEPPI|nr:hypothetical protein NPIL_59821 [Nephila pilipes]
MEPIAVKCFRNFGCADKSLKYIQVRFLSLSGQLYTPRRTLNLENISEKSLFFQLRIKLLCGCDFTPIDCVYAQDIPTMDKDNDNASIPSLEKAEPNTVSTSEDLSSDHNPVYFLVGLDNIILQPQNQILLTNWSKFNQNLSNTMYGNPLINDLNELDKAVDNFALSIQIAINQPSSREKNSTVLTTNPLISSNRSLRINQSESRPHSLNYQAPGRCLPAPTQED